MNLKRRRRQESGTVLIMAVVTTVILAGVMVSLLEVSDSSHRQVRNDFTLLKNQYIAEGASERLRVSLVNDYRRSRMSLPNWLTSVRQGDRFAAPENYSGHDTTEIDATSPQGSRSGWIDTSAVANLHAFGDAVLQTTDLQSTEITQRVSFGSSDLFNLAFLSARTDCMFCHLQVDGDVGSLDFFRPGWGVEGSRGIGSGTGSSINGSVYVASNISMDDVDLAGSPKRINGTEITGDVEVNYSGPQLPEDRDGDGISDFPTIDPDVAQLNASGGLSGGDIVAIESGKKYSDDSARTRISSVDSTHDGNLILVGTPDNPIRIDGNVFITGDVVIKGVTTGRGAIYSGRNVYVAGDLGYKDGPREPGPDEDPDDVARENLAANKDELRLAARSNIVLGNYTNLDDGGNKLPLKDRQEEDFFRDQFGLHSESYFDHATGQELKKVGTDFYDDQGREVPYERIVLADEYDAIVKPSYVNEDGSVDQWLSDTEYRQILGTEDIRDNTWRIRVEGTASEITNQLIENGFTAEEVGQLNGGWNDELSTNIKGSYSNGIYDLTVRRVEEGIKTYTDQVERVDAFLYSNRRIAGKVSGTNLAINGGMISQEIGVLAPGRYKFGWIGGSKYDYLADVGDRENPVNGALYKHLAVNYDYRLRNGGFGFDLVQGNVGRRLFWRRN